MPTPIRIEVDGMTCVPFVALLAGSACWAASNEPIIVADAGGPIVVDGDLSDAAWLEADWHTGFRVLSLPDERASVQTRFKVLHDDRRIYFGIEADEPSVATLKTRQTRRDSSVYNDDSIEVFVDANGDRAEYRHFAVNSAGVLYDAACRQGGHLHVREWDSSAQVEARVGKDRWWVELAVPFVELGLDAGSVGEWGINVTRERRATGDVELTTFAPLLGGFHQPALFAKARLQDADIARYLWEVHRPYDVRILPVGDRLTYRAKVFVKNASGAFRFFRVDADLTTPDGKSSSASVEAGLDDGQSKEYALAVPVPALGDATLTLTLRDRLEPDRVYAVETFPVRLEYSPLTITLIRPGYRDAIFATQKIDRIEIGVKAGLAKPELKRGLVTARLLDASGAQIGKTKRAPAAPEVRLRLPVADLPVGRYRVAVTFKTRREEHLRIRARCVLTRTSSRSWTESRSFPGDGSPSGKASMRRFEMRSTARPSRTTAHRGATTRSSSSSSTASPRPD
ncbi:MAG: sugar-binding protein [Armatimonadota bacterium]